MAAIVAVTTVLRAVLHHANPTTAALFFLLVTFITATVSTLRVAIVASILADLCLNYFFMPPVGTLRIADTENWVALFVFLAVSVVASSLSSAARDRAVARRSEELKSALLASFGHNLRTPLTAIRVAAANIQSPRIDEHDRREQGEVILAEVERLNRLFQNILELAKLDAGAVTTDLRWVHPSEILEAARDQVEHTIRQHSIDVGDDSDRLVRLDPRLTASALAHVLENAAQYTPAGSPIAVDIRVSPDGLTIAVRDRGPGILPDDLPHVFERLYRGSQARQRVSGTGMGLSIARGMLMAQHGRISARNCEDGGAEFTIVVPAESRPLAAGEPAM